jgi:hypothetical protein
MFKLTYRFNILFMIKNIKTKIKEYNPLDMNTYVFINSEMERIYSTPKYRFFLLIDKIKKIGNNR